MKIWWPISVLDIYWEASERLDGNISPLKWGPSHIVWEDESFEDCYIEIVV
jgi:hypothetical protein